MHEVKIYGIPNCDTIKKSLNWLSANGIAYDFHDYKRSGITREKLMAWCKKTGWEKLLNKKSTTWRGIPEKVQQTITTQTAAIKLMLENTSIIKRPVLECGNEIIVGFTETEYHKHLKLKK